MKIGLFLTSVLALALYGCTAETELKCSDPEVVKLAENVTKDLLIKKAKDKFGTILSLTKSASVKSEKDELYKKELEKFSLNWETMLPKSTLKLTNIRTQPSDVKEGKKSSSDPIVCIANVETTLDDIPGTIRALKTYADEKLGNAPPEKKRPVYEGLGELSLFLGLAGSNHSKLSLQGVQYSAQRTDDKKNIVVEVYADITDNFENVVIGLASIGTYISLTAIEVAATSQASTTPPQPTPLVGSEQPPVSATQPAPVQIPQQAPASAVQPTTSAASQQTPVSATQPAPAATPQQVPATAPKQATVSSPQPVQPVVQQQTTQTAPQQEGKSEEDSAQQQEKKAKKAMKKFLKEILQE